ncbi:hypothetical protein H6P81_013952 [Aristolochia fimbriata]|uniref:Reverse transcriptase domain-containing protein n=1 Tax=Aristolochia fimbriata TaxID=158543 RepID=A0AAV7EGL3_ARIFI|nr:hypothetical protein H6P81_013952 [Aristolochia fimbriata]
MQAVTPKQPSQNTASKQTLVQITSIKQNTAQVVSPKQPARDSQPAQGHKSVAVNPTPKQRSIPILWYIPQSQRKKGEAPLVACHKSQPTPLPKKVTVPLPKLEERSIVKQFPNQQQLPATRLNEGFDPNAYRLMARAGGNLTKDQIHAKPPVTLPVLTPEQEKLRNKGQRINQGRAGLGYEKQKPIKIYTGQTKPIKITRKGSADVNQVSVGQTLTEKKDTPKPVVIYTLRAAIARARAYDSVMSIPHSTSQAIAAAVPTRIGAGDRKKEVDKLIAANFIREVTHPTWIANIAPVKKKTGKPVCVDFRDLNKACPKDDFPLSITELMVDVMTGHEALSFMDGSSGYNQIRMDPKDEELICVPRQPKGILRYKVMPFGLKNAGATYQRAMQNIFDDFLHKRVECYVDDLVVKTKQRSDHLLDLRAVFERLRRGIEIDQSKIDAIQKMPAPRNVSELKSFQGHLAYIRRFISNLARRCQPFSRLLKKETPFEWDESCQNAFNNIKAYLTKPPVLVAPTVGRPLLLYIAAQEGSVGALLAQCGDDNKEHSLYYLSRTLVGAELNYTPIEKT